MGVFAVKNDVGIGTIVGSAVFNLCCIIGGTAMFTPTVLTIDWKPITRDSLFYLVSIVLMIWALRDGSVDTTESVILMAAYLLYVVFMCAPTTIRTTTVAPAFTPAFTPPFSPSFTPPCMCVGITRQNSLRTIHAVAIRYPRTPPFAPP